MPEEITNENYEIWYLAPTHNHPARLTRVSNNYSEDFVQKYAEAAPTTIYFFKEVKA